MFIALFTIANIWKQHKRPSADEWIKMWYIYNGILLSHTKELNFAICKFCHFHMDGLGGYYAKWNKSDTERQIPYEITHMWNLKNKANQWI